MRFFSLPYRFNVQETDDHCEYHANYPDVEEFDDVGLPDHHEHTEAELGDHGLKHQQLDVPVADEDLPKVLPHRHLPDDGTGPLITNFLKPRFQQA